MIGTCFLKSILKIDELIKIFLNQEKLQYIVLQFYLPVGHVIVFLDLLNIFKVLNVVTNP